MLLPHVSCCRFPSRSQIWGAHRLKKLVLKRVYVTNATRRNACSDHQNNNIRLLCRRRSLQHPTRSRSWSRLGKGVSVVGIEREDWTSQRDRTGLVGILARCLRLNPSRDESQRHVARLICRQRKASLRVDIRSQCVVADRLAHRQGALREVVVVDGARFGSNLSDNGRAAFQARARKGHWEMG